MKEVILLVLLIAAMITDIQSERIPNGLIVAGWVLASIIQTGSYGVPGGILACRDAICMILICMPLFLLHVIGAGDIKLWSVVGAMQGLAAMWQYAIAFFVLAGAYSLIRMFQQKILAERFYYLIHFIHVNVIRRLYVRGQKNDKSDLPRLCYYDKQRDGRECTIKLAPFTTMACVVVWIGRWIGLC